MITTQDWSTHKDFMSAVKAVAGDLPKEVSEEVYTDMLEVLPPAEFGKTRADLVAPTTEYFLVGEAYTHDQRGRPFYMTFAQAYGKYLYLGLFPILN